MQDLTKIIDAAIDNLSPLYDVLLQHPLTTRQRSSRSSQLYPEAPRYVWATAASLQSFGHLFPGLPIKPEQLRLIQGNADALRDLRGQLLMLYRLCTDTLICTQADGLDLAKGVHNWSRQRAALLFQQDDAQLVREREVALGGTEQFAPCKGRGAKARRAKRQKKQRQLRKKGR